MNLRHRLTIAAEHERTELAADELRRTEAGEQRTRDAAIGYVLDTLHAVLPGETDLIHEATVDHLDVDEALVHVEGITFAVNVGRHAKIRVARLCPHCGSYAVYPHAIMRARDIMDPLAGPIIEHDVTGAPTPQRCDGETIETIEPSAPPAPYRLRRVADEEGGDRVIAALVAQHYHPELLAVGAHGPVILFRHVAP